MRGSSPRLAGVSDTHHADGLHKLVRLGVFDQELAGPDGIASKTYSSSSNVVRMTTTRVPASCGSAHDLFGAQLGAHRSCPLTPGRADSTGGIVLARVFMSVVAFVQASYG